MRNFCHSGSRTHWNKPGSFVKKSRMLLSVSSLLQSLECHTLNIPKYNEEKVHTYCTPPQRIWKRSFVEAKSSRQLT